MFIFDRCHRSWAAVTPTKYECDANNITGTLARSNILLPEKLTNTALVTPTLFCPTCSSVLRVSVFGHISAHNDRHMILLPQFYKTNIKELYFDVLTKYQRCIDDEEESVSGSITDRHGWRGGTQVLQVLKQNKVLRWYMNTMASYIIDKSILVQRPFRQKVQSSTSLALYEGNPPLIGGFNMSCCLHAVCQYTRLNCAS